MLEKLKVLSECCNVSGCEGEMRSFIKKELEFVGLHPIIDETGCIYATKKGVSQQKQKILIAAPMDVTGFLTLFIKKNTGYLVPSGALPPAVGKKIALLDEENRVFRGTPIPERENEWTVKKSGISLGDVFRLSPDLSQKEFSISGYFSTKFAQIRLLLDLAGETASNDVIFLFTASTFTRASKEKNVCRRLNPDHSILLGSVKSEEDKPLLLIKDGTYFPDDALISTFLTRVGATGNHLKATVSTEAVTKASILNASEGVPVLSLALPYREENAKEVFSVKSYDNLYQVLKKYL